MRDENPASVVVLQSDLKTEGVLVRCDKLTVVFPHTTCDGGACFCAELQTRGSDRRRACGRDLDTFKRVFDVNVIGAFAAMQAFVPLLKVRLPHRRSRGCLATLVAVMCVSRSRFSSSMLCPRPRDVLHPCDGCSFWRHGPHPSNCCWADRNFSDAWMSHGAQ